MHDWRHAAYIAAAVAVIAVLPRSILIIVTLTILAACTAAALLAHRLSTTSVHTPPWRPRALVFASPSAWSAVLTRQSWEENLQSVGHDAALDNLLALVRKHLILPWYARISPSPAFPNAIDDLVRRVISTTIEKGSKVDWPMLIVSRIIPLIKNHLQHYRSVEHLGHPLPPKPHPALDHLEVHMREMLDKCLHEVSDEPVIVHTLAREVLLSVVMPVMDMLSDGDFWNRQIDERGARYLHEQ